MFDTNSFDKLIEDLDVVINSDKKNRYYITYVQKQELDNIPSIKKEKKDCLLKMVTILNIKQTLSTVFVLNSTPIGSGKLGNGKVFNELLNEK